MCIWKRRTPGHSWTGAVLLALLVAGLPSPSTSAIAAGEWQTGWPAGQPDGTVRHLVIAPGGRGLLAFTDLTVRISTDGGTTWSSVPTGPRHVRALATAEPVTVVAYVEPNPFSTPNAQPGLHRSTDGGATWSYLGTAVANQLAEVKALAVLPGASPVLLASSVNTQQSPPRRSILRSAGGGALWTKVYDVPGDHFVERFYAAPGNVVYGVLNYTSYGGLIKSVDGGQTWTDLGLTCAGSSRVFPTLLAVDPLDASRVLEACLTSAGGVSFFQTADGGATWTPSNRGLPTAQAGLADLVGDPANGANAFAVGLSYSGSSATATVFRSGDRGDSWTALDGSSPPDLPNARVLVFDPRARLLFAGTESGVWQRWLPPAVAPGFQAYYTAHDGLRLLGQPLGDLSTVQAWPSQYFEKGRLEDHSREVADPNWRFMFGLLADELQNAKAALPVGGDLSTLTYAGLAQLAAASNRQPLPGGFAGGTFQFADGSVFVPYHPALAPETGHTVPAYFWQYVNRADLFPGGWLHDVGLPMIEAVSATVDKGRFRGREITVQLFQRTLLTYDPLNPLDWQVERANVGTDYLKVFAR